MGVLTEMLKRIMVDRLINRVKEMNLKYIDIKRMEKQDMEFPVFIKEFEKNLQVILEKEDYKTEDGKTQEAERGLKKIILAELNKVSESPIEEAGQQQAIDFRNFKYKGKYYNFECKKSDKGEKFMFNDTMVKPDVWYIFNYEKYKKVRIIKGNEIKLLDTRYQTTNCMDRIRDLVNGTQEINGLFVSNLFILTLELAKNCVFSGKMSLFDYGELFKNTTIFGNAVSRPRPNWNIHVPLADKFHVPVNQKEV
jgi:hypothetical protein